MKKKKRAWVEDYETMEDLIVDLNDYWEILGAEKKDDTYILRPYLKMVILYYKRYLLKNIGKGEYTYRQINDELPFVSRFCCKKLF